MSAKINITVNVPEELLFAANVSEETVFECYFEDGRIHISSLSDEELDNARCNGNLSDCEGCRNFCRRLRICMCGMIEDKDRE